MTDQGSNDRPIALNWCALHYAVKPGRRFLSNGALWKHGLQAARRPSQKPHFLMRADSLSLVAEFPDRRPIVLSGIAEDEPDPKSTGRKTTHAKT